MKGKRCDHEVVVKATVKGMGSLALAMSRTADQVDAVQRVLEFDFKEAEKKLLDTYKGLLSGGADFGSVMRWIEEPEEEVVLPSVEALLAKRRSVEEHNEH